MSNWVLEAIEREAMRRAERQLYAFPQVINFMGLSEPQLGWLIRDYETRTGKPASLIDPKAAF